MIESLNLVFVENIYKSLTVGGITIEIEFRLTKLVMFSDSFKELAVFLFLQMHNN